MIFLAQPPQNKKKKEESLAYRQVGEKVFSNYLWTPVSRVMTGKAQPALGMAHLICRNDEN